MANATVAPQESLSDILYRFSISISAIKVAKEALDSPRLDTAIVDQALKLAIDGIDDAYDLFDAAIVRISRESRETTAEVARDIPEITLERLDAQCERILQASELLDDIAKQLDPAVITAREESESKEVAHGG